MKTHPTPTSQPRHRQLALFLLAGTLFIVSSTILFPCGPFIPDSTLGQGTRDLLRTPELSFRYELALILNQTNLDYGWTSPLSTATNTTHTDLADLKTALSQTTPAIPLEIQAQLLEAYRSQRALIQRNLDLESSLYPDTNLPPRITTSPSLIANPGIPLEFALYFDGAVAWHQANLPQARKAWTRLLELPGTERRYRSTWAAFMLGRSWEDTDRTKAIHFFQQTRQLATNGFIDSLQLARDSLGFEARLHFRESNHSKAIELYLEQAGQNDPQAVTSLFVISKLTLQDPQSNLSKLARNPTTRKILTATTLALPLPNNYISRPKRHLDGPVKEALIQA
ncbi:MAG: hypothetical protein ACO34E_08200, partial [Limisphaerales bacterium]